MPDGRKPPRFVDVGRLLLAVEALSPSTKRTARTVKRDLYRDEHVPEYWIVDPKARTIDRWTPASMSAERLTEQLAWQPISGVAPLVIDVEAYFREVHS